MTPVPEPSQQVIFKEKKKKTILTLDQYRLLKTQNKISLAKKKTISSPYAPATSSKKVKTYFSILQ